MRVTNIESRIVKTYTVTVEDGEVRDKPYTSQRYRVQRITVIKQDGNVSSVELHGSVLKKDGTDSLNYASHRLYGQRDWPEWLHGVVGGLS